MEPFKKYQGGKEKSSIKSSISPLPLMVSVPVELSKLQVRLSPQVPLEADARAARVICGSRVSSRARQSARLSHFFSLLIFGSPSHET